MEFLEKPKKERHKTVTCFTPKMSKTFRLSQYKVKRVNFVLHSE